ncbi:MAG: NPCBM/NEW2 domain-containing protein, partial [Verrucomicrobiota bacterium]
MKQVLIGLLACLLSFPVMASAKTKVVLIAGRDSHGAKAHNWGDGVDLLSKALIEESGFEIETSIHKGGWPKENSFFDDAGTVVILADGGGRHPMKGHIKSFSEVMERGVGLVQIHYAVEIPKGEGGDAFLDWMGGYFETHWSVNPHWEADFTMFQSHPVSRGLKPFKMNDEWYYHMRFRPDMEGVTPILSAHPPEQTLKRGDGPHSNNPHVRESVLERMESQHVAWAAVRKNGGRGFGTTGAHYHKAWDNDNFRKMVLNAVIWTAKLEVPEGGVKSLPNPTLRLKGGVGKIVGKKKDQPKKGKGPKPVYESKAITKSTKGHEVGIKADIKGAKDLYLVVTDGGDGYGCDWADWAEPRLTGPAGEKKLTDLKWKSARAGWGAVRVNKNAGGQPLRVQGKAIEYGLGTHANSVIHYAVPDGYDTFHARGVLDNGGTDQGCGSTVTFAVYTKKPSLSATVARGSSGGNFEPAEALQALDVAEGCEATLFAHEPMMVSPSTIDIDHRGRVWVGEVINYRRHRGKRPEGDRILILEDTNGDGKADSSKVFYQGKDIDSLHGVTVLG